MPSRILLFVLLLTLLTLGGAALADITLNTDKPEYLVGEIVHITAHNNGPNVELFLSAPYFLIYNDDLNECVFGCAGLPVVTPFEVGETVTMEWDTGFFPDIPGNYSVSVAVTGGTTVSYLLNAPVSSEGRSWGGVKALFR
jgi:hypothetical protein